MKGDVAAADAARPAQIQPPVRSRSTGKITTCFSSSTSLTAADVVGGEHLEHSHSLES